MAQNFAEGFLRGFQGTIGGLRQMQAYKRQNVLNEQADEDRLERLDDLRVKRERDTTRFDNSLEDRERRMEAEELDEKFARDNHAFKKADIAMSIADREESRQDRETERGYREEDREYLREDRSENRADRQLQREYLKEDRGYRREDRAIAAEDRTYNRARQEEIDAQNLDLHRLNARYKGIMTEGALQDQEARGLEMRLKTQQHNARMSAGITEQAFKLAQSGDFDGAMKLAGKLEDYGYDIPGITKNNLAHRVEDTITQVVQGNMDLGDPAAVEAAQAIFTPSLVQSGRDPKKFEVARIVPLPPQQGAQQGGQQGQQDAGGQPQGQMFTVALRNKETGQIVPATQLASSNPKDKLMTFSMQELMGAGSAWVKNAKGIHEVAMQKALVANLAGVRARAGVMMGEKPVSQGRSGSGKTEPSPEAERAARFIESYGEGSPRHTVATLVVDELGYDPETTAMTVREVEALADEEGITVQEAAPIYINRQKKQGQIAILSERFAADYGVSESEAQNMASKVGSDKWTMTDVQKRIETLEKRSAARAKRSEELKPKIEESNKRLEQGISLR